MSLSSSSTLRVVIDERAVHGVRIERRWFGAGAPVMTGSSTRPIAMSPTASAPLGEQVHAAVTAVLTDLHRARMPIRIELAHALNRYLVLAPDAALRSDDDWSALATHRVAQTWGGAATQWVVRHDQLTRKGHRIASAIARPLLDACVRACGERKARLLGVGPALAPALARAASLVSNEVAWLVSVDRSGLCLLRFDHGNPAALRADRQVPATWSDVRAIVDREARWWPTGDDEAGGVVLVTRRGAGRFPPYMTFDDRRLHEANGLLGAAGPVTGVDVRKRS